MAHLTKEEFLALSNVQMWELFTEFQSKCSAMNEVTQCAQQRPHDVRISSPRDFGTSRGDLQISSQKRPNVTSFVPALENFVSSQGRPYVGKRRPHYFKGTSRRR